MDARHDTLSTKLYQVNTRVGRIARWQAHLGGFVESPPGHLRHLRTMMTPTTTMMIRMKVLAHPALMRCLLDTLSLCHL